MDHQDLLVLREIGAKLEIQVAQDLRDPVVPLARRVVLEIRDLLDLQDLRDSRCVFISRMMKLQIAWYRYIWLYTVV